MASGRNKAKHLSSVNHTTKTIHNNNNNNTVSFFVHIKGVVSIYLYLCVYQSVGHCFFCVLVCVCDIKSEVPRGTKVPRLDKFRSII